MKQRFLILIPLILLLLVSFTSALEVELISPSHQSVYEISNTVSFKCKATGSSLVQLVLKTDISGTMEQTEDPVSSPTNNTEYIFTVENIDNGIYNWNCQVLSSSDPWQAIAPSDRQVEINFLNDPPIFSGPIPNQAWDQDASKDDAFDLDNYFTDTDPITYSVSTTSNIIVDIATNGFVSFSQPAGWWGTETVTFKATDVAGYTDSNEITLTVNQVSSPSNDPPEISGVPDQTKEIDDTWTLYLNSYIDDDEDDDDDLTISVSGVDTSIFTVSIDQDDNKLTFTAEDEGTDDFTITVEDTDGETDSQTITVSIVEELPENDEEEEDDELTIEITESTPDFNNIKIKPGESQKFEVTVNEDTDIIWYVDNVRKDEDTETFTYKPTTTDIGKHTIKVIVGVSPDMDSKLWDIEVEGETIGTTNLCGNDKININETCLNCPEDVTCKENEYCDEGECKTKSLNLITGFVTKSKNFIIEKWYYPTLVLSIILLVVIILIITNMHKTPKKDDDYLQEFSEEKKPLIKRIQARLREWDKKKQLKKNNKKNLNRLETEKKENIRVTAPGIESIITFVNQRLYEGNSNREIKKALKTKGWNRRQIKQAFKKIKNDSRKSNQGNQNPSK